ncbi:MAG: thiamine pyrophosphate-binding protein [Sulfuricaulis sp.]|nr:thiamine pyrophosphate-binding protein [Sulfuricaulis sp.]
MKVAHAIASFLRDQGIGHTFVVSGGADLHIIHAIADTPGIDYICMQHEQACGFAADAYARLCGLGCSIATSGPGFTNGLTPMAASYYDSIPVLFICGQVTIARLGEGWGVRQTGFQQTPAVEVATPICKYAVEPHRVEDVLHELHEAVRIARSGRPGPALVSIPDDLQRSEI